MLVDASIYVVTIMNKCTALEISSGVKYARLDMTGMVYIDGFYDVLLDMAKQRAQERLIERDRNSMSRIRAKFSPGADVRSRFVRNCSD